MARPIAPTPKLDEKATRKFLDMVERGLKKTVGPVPTPKLSKAIKMILSDATDPKK
jgi:hypothetical protein